MIRLLFLLFLFCSVSVSAATLPDPLNLQQAMALATDKQHYQIIEAQAAITEAQSDIEQAESKLGFMAQIELEAAYIEPSRIAFDQSRNDSSASLRLIKPLYDFGATDNALLAANIEQDALQNHMHFIIAQRKFDIAQQFFEVILSDLKYAWDNETMAAAYVRFDSDKDRHALSQLSDVELLESENRYLNILNVRSFSEIQQRHSRATLAELLNQPSQLPDNLTTPKFSFLQKNLPEYELLLDKIMLNNPQLKLAQKQLDAANKRMTAASKQFGPRLNAELKVSEYARTKGSNDDWRVQLNLVVPLYENSGIKKDITKARANWLKKSALLLKIKTQLRKQALSLWQNIGLLSQRQKQLQTTQEFRELDLDKSRALYEMEVKTNLGTSMAAISEIQYRQAKNNFELALSWMQLQLLVGKSDIMQTSL